MKKQILRLTIFPPYITQGVNKDFKSNILYSRLKKDQICCSLHSFFSKSKFFVYCSRSMIFCVYVLLFKKTKINLLFLKYPGTCLA